MKRVVISLLLLSAGLAAAWAAVQSGPPQSERSLSAFVPQGSLLYLEAKDFSGLLSDWNRSPEKRSWMASDNFEVFSRSRLLLRLKEADSQFSAAAGLPADANLVSQVAGKESVFALYDIGKLQFLYITRLPSASAMQSALWQSRANFETRNAGGIAFFRRRDAESGREVEFAVTGNYLLLATREDLMASALELIAAGNGPSIVSEAWWSNAVAATATAGDLRMVLKLEKIVPSPYFRSYWIQRNAADLKGYSAAVSDLFRSGREYREERVLLRKTPKEGVVTANEGFAIAASLVPMVPAEASFYRVQAEPPAEMCVDWLQSKILAPRPAAGPPSRFAPQFPATQAVTGSSADLETRIDQPMVRQENAGSGTEELKSLVGRAGVRAMSQFERVETEPGGVFVRIHSVVALAASRNWEEPEVRDVLAAYAKEAFSAGELGATWEARNGYQTLNGLWPLAVAVRGKLLIIADDPATLEMVLRSASQKTTVAPAEYLAGFRHDREQPNFLRLTSTLDRAGAQNVYPNSQRTPEFFSENMGSLSKTLSGLVSETIAVRPDSSKVTETVVYEWNR